MEKEDKVAEKRLVSLLDTASEVVTQVEVVVKPIKLKHLSNVAPEDIDAANVEAAADRAREEYEAKHGGHYLVVGIERR